MTHFQDLMRMVAIATDDCVLWNHAVYSDGYGKIKYKGKTYQTHRLTYLLWGGFIPPKYCVMHKCDTPGCVNLRHLRVGTHADNIRDRDEKGRQPRGEQRYNSKATDEIVRKMRSEYIFGSSTHGTFALARKYGLHQTTVYDIVNNIIWTHVCNVVREKAS